MSAASHDLLKRMEAFSLDDPLAAFPFSKRLALENHWSWTYAQRVIVEYKRLAFLAVAAGHAVSPSEDVDQAWHLHLCYSQSYWEDFCPNVLRQPLHHSPTLGGAAEKAKHTDWYAKTLLSYEQFFGQLPPTDIWPAAKDRFRPTRFARVDLAQYWVMPKLRWGRHATKRTAAVVIGLTIAVSVAAIPHSPNPLDWQGLQFLKFYLALFIGGSLLAFALRWLLRGPGDSPWQKVPSLDPYEVAYLAGGKFRTADAAIVRLLEYGDLNFDQTTQSISPRTLSAQHTENPVERAIMDMVSIDGSIRRVRIAAAKATTGIHHRLAEQGLLLTKSRGMLSRCVPALLMASILLIGVSKIALGISRHKPVGFLMVLCILTVVVIAFLLRPSRRSRWGNKLFAKLRGQKGKTVHSAMPTGTLPPELSLSVALFGAAALTGTEFGFFQPHIEREPFRLQYSGYSNSQNSGGCSGVSGGCGGGGGGGCGSGCGGCGS